MDRNGTKVLAATSEVSSVFGVTDLIVFVAFLSISASIGLYHAFAGAGQKTTRQYHHGGRQIGWFPVALSVMATTASSSTLLGVPADIYLHGTMYMWRSVALFIALPLVIYGYMPVFYQLQFTSAYEYFEKRFSRPLRLFVSVVYILKTLIYMSIVMYGPSLALSQMTGLHVWVSVGLVGSVCIMYTSVGGMKAVIWTDVFQALLMYLTIITVIVKGCYEVGGPSVVWNRNVAGKRAEFMNVDPSFTTRYTLWSVVTGGTVLFIYNFGANQAQIQRYLATPDIKLAKRALWFNVPATIAIFLLSCFAGMVIYAYYYDCDPVRTKRIEKPDQLLPLLFMDTLGHIPGLAGLFASGIFSASLSTLSSGLNALSAISFEDFVKPRLSAGISESRKTLISKFLAFGFGLASIALVSVASNLGNIIQASLTIAGMINGPLAGLITLGMFFRFANNKGAVAGIVVSLGLMLIMGFGKIFHKVSTTSHLPSNVEGCPASLTTSIANVTSSRNDEEIWTIYRISYMWFTPISMVVTLVVGILVSIVTSIGYKTAPVDNRFLSPLLFQMLRLLKIKVPEQIKSKVPEANGIQINWNGVGGKEMNGDLVGVEDQRRINLADIPVKS